jgi:hypothetical protein
MKNASIPESLSTAARRSVSGGRIADRHITPGGVFRSSAGLSGKSSGRGHGGDERLEAGNEIAGLFCFSGRLVIGYHRFVLEPASADHARDIRYTRRINGG